MLNNLTASEFEIGSVRFRVNKLGALQGWRMLERIRAVVANTPLPDGVELLSEKGFGHIIGAVSPEFTDDIREELFKNVEYKSGSVTKGWLPLHSTFDMAFAELEISAIYEVLLRSLVVNFSGSLAGINSLSSLSGAGSST